MMPNRRVLLSLSAVAGLALTAACAPSASSMPAEAPAAAAGPATPEMISMGRTLFAGAGRCGVCHAPTGRGGSLGPNLTDDDWIWVDPNMAMRPQIAAIVRNGIAEPREYPAPMPAQGGGSLTEEQIQALAAFVESL